MSEAAEFVILTGLSGAGKSLAMKCFEDLGFFCVDNLPPVLIPKFAQLFATSSSNRLALVIRGSEQLQELQEALQQLPALGFEPKMLFLEATEDVLLRRYAESRRRHPKGRNQGVLQAIREEAQTLLPLRKMADRILDTSTLTPHQLMRRLQSLFNMVGEQKIALHLVSFGFKHGLPRDADYVFDVRFLPNPYYVEELRPLTGMDPAVRQYVLDRPQAEEFLSRLKALLDFVLPRYFAEGKQHLTLAIGCTGGQHRSTSIAEHMAKEYRKEGHFVSVQHRDMKADKIKTPS
ncbi:MAG: RNase adapter RapZ [Candidatus Eremiobacteraeota bacterium]|nr:RNase adapter RapZ [Candidatus Eremiobacteraeota bacterium]